jgi:replicative DNA helicase
MMEEVILKNLIINGDYFAKVFPHLKESHFDTLENTEIFKALSEYNREYDSAPNVKELGLFIKNSGTVSDSVKGKVIDRYKEVMLEPPVENQDFLIDQTEKYIQKEELSEAIFKSADLIENDQPFEPIIGMIENALSVSFDYDTGMVYKDASASQDRYDYYTQRISGLSLGLPSVDRALGSGLRSKTLNLVVAPSHGGKSALLMSAASTAYLGKKNVLFISLEMTDMEISRRIDANLLNHPANDLGSLNRKEFMTRLEEISKLAGNLVIKDYSAGTFSVLMLKSLMNELKAKDGFSPDIICIDYIGLMNSTRTTISQSGGYAFYKSIAEELHGFSKQEDVIIFTAAQLNRGAYDNLDSGLDSIADSLGVIQTADNVIALLSNGQLREMNQSLIKFLKNRNTGRLSSHLVEVDFATVRFTDLDEDDGTQTAVNSVNAAVLQTATEKEVNTAIMNFN